MPGTKGSGRPGGNPDLEKFQFKQKYDWDEPCTALVAVRVPPKISEEFKKLPNWQERLRKAIARELEAPETGEEQKN